MRGKDRLFLVLLIYISIISFLVIRFGGEKRDNYKPGVSAVFDKAVVQAQSQFKAKQAAGVDFVNGPCLTNDLFQGWVVDIVHNPRKSIDDLPQNQCQALIEGRAEHFVELDLEGNVVRVK